MAMLSLSVTLDPICPHGHSFRTTTEFRYQIYPISDGKIIENDISGTENILSVFGAKTPYSNFIRISVDGA